MGGVLGNIGRWFRRETRAAPSVPPAPGKYVERDDDWCRCHPGRLEGVTADLFPLPLDEDGDGKELKALCRKLFMDPSNQTVIVEPLGKGVVIGMFKYTRADSLKNGELGYLAYNEGAVFIPVWLTVETEKISRFAVAVPYLFVDRFPPIVTGLETFGFFKRHANINFSSNSWCVRADVVPEREPYEIKEDVVLKICPAVAMDAFQENQRQFSETTGISSRLQTIAEVILEPLKPVKPLATVGPFNEPAVVLLKQFRDATDPNLACHQSIVLAGLEVTEVLPGWAMLVGGFDCDIPNYDRPRIATTLGLGTQNTIAIGVRMVLSFNLKSGETVWP